MPLSILSDYYSSLLLQSSVELLLDYQTPRIRAAEHRVLLRGGGEVYEFQLRIVHRCRGEEENEADEKDAGGGLNRNYCRGGLVEDFPKKALI